MYICAHGLMHRSMLLPPCVYAPSALPEPMVQCVCPLRFVRAEPGHQTASLTILPYGFPRLWVLLDKLQGLPNGVPGLDLGPG